MMRFLTALSVPILLYGCSSTPVVDTTASIGPLRSYERVEQMAVKGKAFPPPAFNSFCSNNPRLCSTGGSTKTFSLTAARAAQLSEVNLAVNKRIHEQSDKASTGKADVWGMPRNVGDCEDFAILKKHELMKRGWPASVLLLTVATSGGEGHVVLTVRTDKGDLILDNRTNSIKPWTRAPYKFFARQSQSSGRSWERIGA